MAESVVLHIRLLAPISYLKLVTGKFHPTRFSNPGNYQNDTAEMLHRHICHSFSFRASLRNSSEIKYLLEEANLDKRYGEYLE